MDQLWSQPIISTFPRDGNRQGRSSSVSGFCLSRLSSPPAHILLLFKLYFTLRRTGEIIDCSISGVLSFIQILFANILASIFFDTSPAPSTIEYPRLLKVSQVKIKRTKVTMYYSLYLTVHHLAILPLDEVFL